MLNATRTFAGNCPDENCTERTAEWDDDASDADATAPEDGDKNDTGVLGAKFQPEPDSVISNLPVLGIEHSGRRVKVIVT